MAGHRNSPSSNYPWDHTTRSASSFLLTTMSLFYCDQRLLIPTSFRHTILTTIHDDGHQGVAKCRLRARQSVWWPVLWCRVACHAMPYLCRMPPESAGPLSPSNSPRLPWEKVACDRSDHNGKQYLILVDCFSRYIAVEQLSSTTSSAVIKVFNRIFSIRGIPNTGIPDNGPQFASDQFRSYALEMGFHHQTSRPDLQPSLRLKQRSGWECCPNGQESTPQEHQLGCRSPCLP